MDQNKRELREQKRVIKRAGHKHRRQILKKTLSESPDEAALFEDSFGRYRSAEFNGMDHDATRRRSRTPAPLESQGPESCIVQGEQAS